MQLDSYKDKHGNIRGFPIEPKSKKVDWDLLGRLLGAAATFGLIGSCIYKGVTG